MKHSREEKLWRSRVNVGSLGKHDTVIGAHTVGTHVILGSYGTAPLLICLNTLKHVNIFPFFDPLTNQKSEGQFLRNSESEHSSFFKT